MSAQVIPIAQGGHGRYTWERSKVHHYYRIRRGARAVASVSIVADIPFHGEIMRRICQALDDQEREAT